MFLVKLGKKKSTMLKALCCGKLAGKEAVKFDNM